MIFCKIYYFSTVCTSPSSTQVSCFNSNILLKALQSRVIRIFSTDFLATAQIAPSLCADFSIKRRFLNLRLSITTYHFCRRAWDEGIERRKGGGRRVRTKIWQLHEQYVHIQYILCVCVCVCVCV